MEFDLVDGFIKCLANKNNPNFYLEDIKSSISSISIGMEAIRF